jgi:hypothetical protein
MWRIARVEGLLDADTEDAGAAGDVKRSHITHFVREAPVVAWCLARLRETLHELACPVAIMRLVMHPQPFCPENGLQTPTFRLRRDRIRNTFVPHGSAPR